MRGETTFNETYDCKVIGSEKVVMSDVDFPLIMSNPPYHTDFSVAKAFIEGSYKHLQTGGWLVMVCKHLSWYIRYS